MQNFNL